MWHVRAVTAVAVILFLAACGDGDPPGDSPDATATPPLGGPTSTGPSALVIWADTPLVPVLEELAAMAGVTVTIREIGPDLVPAELAPPSPPPVSSLSPTSSPTSTTTSSPTGSASVIPAPGSPPGSTTAETPPDLVALAHDSIGPLVAQGVLAPLDLGGMGSEFLPVAARAFASGVRSYGLPFAVENVALVRNADLVTDPPASFEDLEQVALSLKGTGSVDVAFGLPVPDPYHEYPLFASMGGYAFGSDPAGNLNPNDLGIDSPGGLQAAAAYSLWTTEGLIDPSLTVDAMIAAFAGGRTPFAVTGPWVVSDPVQGVQNAGFPFVVEPIPPVRGEAPRPFVRVLGFGVPSGAVNRDAARAFALDTLATPQAQAKLAAAVDRPPALAAALDDPSLDPILRGFGLSARDGDPVPAIPEMAHVWGPWADAYAKIFQQTAPPDQAFRDAAAAIRSAIASGAPPPSAPGD